MLLSEAFNLYQRDVIAFRNQSAKTEENHFICMRALISYTGDLNTEDLNFELVRKWKQHLQIKRSPVTVRNYIVKLRVVLGFLQLRGIPCVSPDEVPVPQRVETVPVCVRREQVQTLIDSTNKIKNKAIISFLWASGLRISELCSLNIGDIHNKSFTVVGKGGYARPCFIDERTEGLLNQYLLTRDDNKPALFLTDAGHRITPGVIQETFKTVRKRSGIQCHPHSMRHGFATNLLKSNTNLYHVSRFLGHKRLDTTKQYLHVYDYELEQIYREKHSI